MSQRHFTLQGVTSTKEGLEYSIHGMVSLIVLYWICSSAMLTIYLVILSNGCLCVFVFAHVDMCVRVSVTDKKILQLCVQCAQKIIDQM